MRRELEVLVPLRHGTNNLKGFLPNKCPEITPLNTTAQVPLQDAKSSARGVSGTETW